MARLYLVRHGQASFGSSDYDNLSKLGWQQGEVLGRWFQGHVQPAGLFSGTLQRHLQTAQALRQGYGETLPGLATDAGFNEFDHEAIVHRWRPAWSDRSVMAADLASQPHPAKAFQKAFSEAMQRWVGGEYDDYPESWVAFRGRVLAAFERLLGEEADGDLVLVSSGGPITVIVQHLLELSDQRALELNHVMANTGVTQVLFSGQRRTLAVFNSFAHLEAESPKLVTYR